MDNAWFGIALIPLILCIFLIGWFVVSILYPISDKKSDSDQSQFKKGYTAGWNAAEKYLHNKYSKAFEQFEYDNTQLALENESLKKAYELWVKNRVGQLLKKGL